MSQSSRRAFLGQIGSAAFALPTWRTLPLRVGSASAPVPQTASAPLQGPPGTTPALYDLLIAGGRVIDPAQKLSADRDVAIVGGRIARVAANIPTDQARQVYDARGKIVTPGLIDL